MNIQNSVDQLIASLETFRTTLPKMNDDTDSTVEFSALLEDASEKLEVLSAQRESPTETTLSRLDADTVAEVDLEAANWLTEDETTASLDKPNLREFKDATGLSAVDASEILYGVIGTNSDLRDWSKIMSSNDPLNAARIATGQLYNSDMEYALVNHGDYNSLNFEETLHSKSLSSRTVIQESGNFAEIEVMGGAKTMAVSSTGLLLREAGDTQRQIERTAWLFGFDAPDWF